MKSITKRDIVIIVVITIILIYFAKGTQEFYAIKRDFDVKMHETEKSYEAFNEQIMAIEEGKEVPFEQFKERYEDFANKMLEWGTVFQEAVDLEMIPVDTMISYPHTYGHAKILFARIAWEEYKLNVNEEIEFEKNNPEMKRKGLIDMMRMEAENLFAN